MSRAVQRTTLPAVEWSDGVHLVSTPLWCDARVSRGACFVSSAQSYLARRHRQMIATDITARLLFGNDTSTHPSMLSVPFGRPFSLGQLRLELFPSGTMPGAASLLAHTGGDRVVYAGRIKPRGGRVAGEAEARACDVLVLHATFGEPHFRFPARETVVKKMCSWVDAVLADGHTPVFLAEPLSNGLEIVGLLGEKYDVRAHREIATAVGQLRASKSAPIPKARRYANRAVPEQVVVWPVGKRDAHALAVLKKARFALVSGWAAQKGMAENLRAEIGFPLADQAGYEELVSYVEQSGASRVYLVGGGERLGNELQKKGLDVQSLGPPTQLPLF